MNSTSALSASVSDALSSSTLAVCARSSASAVFVVGGGSARNWSADRKANGRTRPQCGVRKPGVNFVPSERVNSIGCHRSGSTMRSTGLTGW